eukprot:1153750-Pelagomonas_calceolata.AAC.3
MGGCLVASCGTRLERAAADAVSGLLLAAWVAALLPHVARAWSALLLRQGMEALSHSLASASAPANNRMFRRVCEHWKLAAPEKHGGSPLHCTPPNSSSCSKSDRSTTN